MTPRWTAGFTLVELMMTLAVASVLAAIAVPLYADHQREARAAEVPVMVDGLFHTASAQQAEEDAWPDWGVWQPNALPGKQARPWLSNPAAPSATPDGLVYGSYTIAAAPNAMCLLEVATALQCPPGGGCVGGMTDLDEDGTRRCVYKTTQGGLVVLDAGIY